ncbi:MAG: DUF423 domain-containing protein [Gemmatimonadota bacterium]|jgi:uncharacterized membrane protein YgdD (TMEM256/DUF423 family)
MMKPNNFSENRLRDRWIGATGALFGLLAVALGAFGAHGLRGRLSPGDLAIFEVAVRYQMYHALGLVLVAVLAALAPGFRGRGVGWAFTLGVLIFSGSLYALVLTGQRWLGALTPLGGVAFLVGWGALAWSFIRREHA